MERPYLSAIHGKAPRLTSRGFFIARVFYGNLLIACVSIGYAFLEKEYRQQENRGPSALAGNPPRFAAALLS